NDTETDAPLAALGEHFGMSREGANRLDMGVSMISVFADGVGLVNMFREATTFAGKGLTVASGAMTADNLQAQGRYVVFNQENAQTGGAWLIQHTTGMSAENANYVDMGLGMATGVAGTKGVLTKDTWRPYITKDRWVNIKTGAKDGWSALKGGTPTTRF